jgi:hypothetical protein
VKTKALAKRLRKYALTLRAGGFPGIHDDYIEAADALEAQAREIEGLREALEEVCNLVAGDAGASYALRRPKEIARRALEPPKEDQ